MSSTLTSRHPGRRGREAPRTRQVQYCKLEEAGKGCGPTSPKAIGVNRLHSLHGAPFHDVPGGVPPRCRMSESATSPCQVPQTQGFLAWASIVQLVSRTSGRAATAAPHTAQSTSREMTEQDYSGTRPLRYWHMGRRPTATMYIHTITQPCTVYTRTYADRLGSRKIKTDPTEPTAFLPKRCSMHAGRGNCTLSSSGCKTPRLSPKELSRLGSLPFSAAIDQSWPTKPRRCRGREGLENDAILPQVGLPRGVHSCP